MNRVWLLFAATTALHFLSDNEADNDLWMHLFLGRRILSSGAIPRIDDLSFTAAGAPWVDHEWLAQVVFAAIYDWSGDTGLWLFKLGIGLCTAWLIWRSIRRATGGDSTVPLQVFVLVLALATLSRGFSVRPQIFTYLFVAAMLLWLDTKRGKSVVLGTTAPLAAVWLCLWSNLHGAFIVGLGILGLWAVAPPWGDLESRDGRLELAKRLCVPAIALAAVAINPYGPGLFTYILGELSVPHPLTEWQPVRFGDPAQWPFWTILVGTVVTVPFARTLRASPWRAALLVITAFLAVRHQRHVPLFAICAAAPLADQLCNAIGRARLPDLSTPARAVIAAAVLVLALAQVGLVATRLYRDRAGIVFEADDYPVGAVAYLHERGMEGNLALPLDWGNYCLWHLSPDIKVSMDGRFATVYPPSAIEENFDLFGGVDDRLLERYRPEYVLTVGNVQMHALDDHGYRLIYRDPVSVLYSRDITPAPVTAAARTGRLPFP